MSRRTRLLKQLLFPALSRTPRLFDVAKRVSRILGDRSQLYLFLSEFATRRPRCRFLQIGSNDGITGDPLREFIIASEWTGILVEPVPYVFERLRKNYCHRAGLQFENVAVSNHSGRARFYAVDPATLHRLHPSAPLLSSFDRSLILKQFAAADEVDKHLMEFHVPTVTVSELLDKCGFEAIDLLHIDAEGHEPEILGTIDFARTRPEAIIFEHRHLGERSQPVLDLLDTSGYVCFEIDEDDSVAIRRDLQFGWAEARGAARGALA